MPKTYGATPAEWSRLRLLGLGEDLLPVVSNPNAKISANSKIAQLGKTPSMYNTMGTVGGIREWTQQHPNKQTLDSWSKVPDYGICIQTRSTRAIDIDISDSEGQSRVAARVREYLGNLPRRTRANSEKSLFAFTLPGDYTKRVLRTETGIIEFLATGQQFVAFGTHPSGVRYEWDTGLPSSFPDVTPEQFEELWAVLEAEFATEPGTTSKASAKREVLLEAYKADPVARYFVENDLLLSQEKDGRMHVTCPWEDEHTSESAESATTYFPAHTGGYEQGNFKCLHAHCERRTVFDVRSHLGLDVDDFEDISDTPRPDNAPPRFSVVPAHLFASGEPPTWLVKGVLPQAGLAVMFGDSGSGKTFFALDMVMSITQGLPWRGRQVKQGGVVYVCAEGAGGFRNRLKAYAHQHQVDLSSLPIGVVGEAPNLMAKADAKDLLAAIKAFGDTAVIVMDTFAQVMPGANENSGEDVGTALAHCRALHNHTGALVLLIHHSGKDAARGARGWSGLRAAADAEIEILRSEHDRVATVTKLKDGEDGAEFGFKLHQVVLAMDEDGEDISSCVIEHNDRSLREVRRAASEPKGANEKLVLRLAQDMAGLVDGTVYLTELISRAVNEMPFDEGSGKRDRRRELVVRAIEALREGRRIVLQDGSVRVAEGV